MSRAAAAPGAASARTGSLALGALLAVLGLVALMAVPPLASASLLHGRMQNVHLVLELAAVIVAALVVAVSWHTFDEPRRPSASVIAAGFGVVAVCDLMHALAYDGMPDFIVASSTGRAIYFWLAGRAVEVATLGLVAWGGVRRMPRGLAIAAAAGASAGIVWIGCWQLEALPDTFVLGRGVTTFKARCEYLLCAANLTVAWLLVRRAALDGHPPWRLLALSSLLMGIGGLAFTSYVAPSDFQNVFGHLYKLAAYALLYRATFIDGIRAPFAALRESEARLRESELRLRTLSDNLPQCAVYQLVLETDGRRRFTHVSEAIERLTGLKVADVLADAQRLYALVHPEDRGVLAQAEQRSLDTLQVFDVCIRQYRVDGSARRMQLVSAPRRLDDGRIVWDGTQTDVTERELAEESRRTLEAQLRQAQKMESIGTLASGIAHDFNNIIGAIVGHTALAREDAERGERAALLRSLDQSHAASLRARELVQRILAFGRRQSAQRRVQSLQAVVGDALSLLKSTLPAGVVLRTRFPAAPVWVRLDTTQIAQVVINLCTNAWQAMPRNAGRIDVGIEASERQICLSVADDGSGMDEATRQRVFEPFFTTKPAGIGTGLGLSVVHGIVLQHDGAISLQSSPGLGTVFRICLPASPAPGEPAEAGPGRARPLGRGERVLYIDDDEIMLLMVERLLVREGYAARVFQDPVAALVALRADPLAFDIVVTDYNMPGLSGDDVAREVAAIRPGLPVVLTSGSVDDELLARMASLGVEGVVEKQNTLEQLGRALERALREARPAAARLGVRPAGAAIA